MKVLVLSARGLRADSLGCYGNPHVETPALDALAAAGVVFERHFAAATDPAAARRAWRTGRYPVPGAEPPPDAADLVTLLKERGIATALVVDASRPAVDDFARGWQMTTVVPAEGDDTLLERTVNAARTALLRLQGRTRWLLWVDVGTLLPPWDVPADFAEHYFKDEVLEEDEGEDDEEAIAVEPLTPLPNPTPGPVDPEDDTPYLRIQGSYAGAVTYLDAGLAEIVRGVEDDVLVLVTADAGFALGEHGVVGPGLTWPPETVTQVPLIVRFPDRTAAGSRAAALTQAVDLAPTLAALFDVWLPSPHDTKGTRTREPLPDAHGHDLGPLIRGEVEALRPYAVSWSTVGNLVGRALRSPEWSFVLPGVSEGEAVPRLYVRPDDHWEVNDVRQHHLELAEALEKTLRDFELAAAQPGPLAVPPLPEEDAVQPAAE